MSSPEPIAAVSPDGRTFTLSAPEAVSLVHGDLVVLQPDHGEDLLGQVIQRGVAAGDMAWAANGVLIGVLDSERVVHRTDMKPFSSAVVVPASAEQLEQLQHTSGADLPIGTWTCGGVTVPARLRSQGFSRHTFLCGQSGSGKTYALGVILEQLLLGTDLRIVVLDPNADFVRLGETRSDAPPDAARRMEDIDLRVLGADATSAEPLRARFATMPRHAQAAILRMDPLADRAEYNAFLHLMGDLAHMDIPQLVSTLRNGDQDAQALGQRIENLAVLDWEIWAQQQQSAAEVVAGGARVTVMDLSGLSDPQEPLALSLDLVEQLWTQRGARIPTLIVIDEAHNLCPATPRGPIEASLVERLTQIAAEGRKYGLWLFLSSQRPSKIDPQVLSQCDNLVVMRMNSPGDAAELTGMFGFAPAAMLALSNYFRQGEALVAGGFVPRPALIRVGQRLTHEGGTDVPVPVSQL